MKMYLFVGVYTPLALKEASRINALQDDSAAPATNYVAIDDTNGNEVDCGNERENIFVIVKNTSGSNALTVTQKAYTTVSGIVLPDEATVIPFGDEAIIGPINTNPMMDTDVVRLDFSGTTPTGKIMAMVVKFNDD